MVWDGIRTETGNDAINQEGATIVRTENGSSAWNDMLRNRTSMQKSHKNAHGDTTQKHRHTLSKHKWYIRQWLHVNTHLQSLSFSFRRMIDEGMRTICCHNSYDRAINRRPSCFVMLEGGNTEVIASHTNTVNKANNEFITTGTQFKALWSSDKVWITSKIQN